MKRLISVIFTFTALSVSIQAQDGWERTYGTSKADYGYCVRQTGDDCFIVTGVRDGNDLWLLKIDANGDTLWTRTYQGGAGHWVEKTSDGGYIITGLKGSRGSWVLRTDEKGDTLWSKVYENSISRRIQPAVDGGYVICGYSYDNGGGVWLAKITTNGVLVWSTIFKIPLWDEICYGTGYSLCRTTDGGYFVVGYLMAHYLTYQNTMDFPFLVKTNSTGDTLWSHVYLTDNRCEGAAYDVLQTSDNCYVLVGLSFFGGVGSNLWMMKTDEEGDSIWAHTYDGGKGGDGASSVFQTDDGGYIVLGMTFVSDPLNFDLWLLKTDTEGDSVWTRKYGPESTIFDQGECVQQTSDGGYIITGSTQNELWLLKTDSLGYVSIEEQLPQNCNTTWQLLSTIGLQIELQFENPSPASSLTLSVFDASGRKVDEISTLQSSGVITWGKGHSPGVYFIREASSPAPAQKVVLVR